jgi:glycosyltransferase involved in cell wall biosynthesis
MKDIPHLLMHPPQTRQPLRIAVVTETYPPEVNGVANTTQRMVRGLISRYHQVRLVRPRQGSADVGASSAQFEETLVRGIALPGYAGLSMGLPAKAQLLRLWRAQRPHLVQVITEGPLGWSAMAAARKLGLPVISNFHTNFHAYSRYYGVGMLSGPIKGYLRWLHNRAQCTLVPTDSLRFELASAGFRNVRVLSRGVDTELFHPARWNALLRQSWGATQNSLVALYVGRIAAEKNLPLLLDAFRRIQAGRGDAKLVLVGDGPERARLQAMNPDVIFAGMQSGVALAEHYASADLFLFPSTTETFGNVVLEAMASGLPTAAYDYAATREHIRHGENGLRAAYDDPLEFLAQAQHLAADSGELRRMGRNARLCAEKLDWKRIHDEFELLIDSVMRKWERERDAASRLFFVPDL